MIYWEKVRLTKMFYDQIARPVLFRLDPELMHGSTIKIGSLVSKSSAALPFASTVL